MYRKGDTLTEVCSFLLFWSITAPNLLNMLKEIVKNIKQNYKIRLINVSLRRENVPYCALFTR